jgi:hypothetical protein
MKIIKISALLIVLLAVLSCAKITDEPFDTNEVTAVTTDSVFIRQYINSLYNHIPSGYNRLNNSMLDASTDLAMHNTVGSPAFRIGTGSWGAFDNPDDAWAENYAGIRAANIYFEDIEPFIPSKVISDSLYKNELSGQVYFLRALFYTELIKRYGGVPIIERVYKAGERVEETRSTYDQTVSYIIESLDMAEKLLPEAYQNNNASDFGRATRGAALTLKSRVLLYAASPLFNSPDQSGSEPWHGAYNPEKWEWAAEAAFQVINTNIYELFPNYFRYFTLLDGSNKELIFNRISTPNNTVERINGPTGITGGGGATGPSLNLVDAYRMSDGTPFNWNNPEHASSPFENRENRFVGSIIWNGREWMDHTVETFDGGADMLSVNSTKTGFYLRKFKDGNAKWFGGETGVTNHCWPILRYAEVLLNFAEAMNEAYGPYNDPKGYGLNAAQALEMIRERAKLDPFLVPSHLNKEEMRKLIHLERKLEFAFEEHRPFDLRRWKKAMTVLNQPVMGLQIIKSEDGSFTYTQKVAEERNFTERMYLYPIPQNEINKNQAIIQNPGW